MEGEIGLWVCPNCNVLQGIDVHYRDGEYRARCVSCGVPLDINEVHFIDQFFARAVVEEVERVLPEDLHSYVRYHWVSNRTLGIVFELSFEEVQEETDVDIMEFLEEDLAKQLGIVITIYFE